MYTCVALMQHLHATGVVRDTLSVTQEKTLFKTDLRTIFKCHKLIKQRPIFIISSYFKILNKILSR